MAESLAVVMNLTHLWGAICRASYYNAFKYAKVAAIWSTPRCSAARSSHHGAHIGKAFTVHDLSSYQPGLCLRYPGLGYDAPATLSHPSRCTMLRSGAVGVRRPVDQPVASSPRKLARPTNISNPAAVFRPRVVDDGQADALGNMSTTGLHGIRVECASP